MNNKRGAIGITITLGMIIVAAIVIGFLLISGGLLINTIIKNIWLILGAAVLIFGFIFVVAKVESNKKLPAFLIVVLIAGALVAFNYLSGTQETAFTATDWTKSAISCVVVPDCTIFLLNEGVSQTDLDTAEFKCEENFCWFKAK